MPCTDDIQTLQDISRDVCGQKQDLDIIRAQMCKWAPPQYGDTGEQLRAAFFQAAALAIAILNGLAQAEIADKQQDLADSWYGHAKYKWDRFNDKYVPLEKKLLAEVSNVPIRNIDCDGAEARAQNATNSAYDGANKYLSRTAKSYRICLDPSLLTYMDLRRNKMLVDTENYNLADERWFTDFKNDQRWNRRSNVLNLGRNLNSEALKYGDVANALYKQVGQQIERAAGGLMQAFGYFGARNDTYYPTTYLQGQSTLVQMSSPYGTLGGADPYGGGSTFPTEK